MAYESNFTEDVISLVDGLVSAEKLEMSNLIFTKAFGVSDITQSHEVVPGVRHGNLVPIIKTSTNYESFPFNDPTSCEKPECELTDEFSTHRWDLGLIECRVPICMRTFDENFLKFWNEYRQIANDPDLTTAFLQYLAGKFQENHRAAMWRTIYFGDTASASTLFNGFDGFFAQAEAIPENVISIEQNTGATFAQQKMTGQQVYELLEDMYLRASEKAWFDESILEFKIPLFMANALITMLNQAGDLSQYNCDCINPDTIVGRRRFTVDGLRMFGLPVSVHKEWDGVINGTAELNGGGGANARVNPNRALLTYKSNLLIGTSETQALSYFDIFYDKKDNKIYMDGGSYIGAAIPTDEYILATGASGS